MIGSLRIGLVAAVAAFVVAATPANARQSERCTDFFNCLFGGLVGSDRATSVSRGSGSTGAFVQSGRTRQMISYPEAAKHKPGTILISTSERKLYYIVGDGKAMMYRVGVGREGFQWSGTAKISRQAEWPGWTPPPAMIAREKKKGVILPTHMPGGPNNPLGARALYLGGTLFRIHGTNAEHTIGGAVSSGCIRMMNDDVIDLYERAKIGSTVIVRR